MTLQRCTHQCPAHCNTFLKPATLGETFSQIAQLEESLYALKRHANTLPPIARLPPEILCEILTSSIPELERPTPPSVANGFTEYKFIENPNLFLANLFRLTHICHDWREMLLRFPAYWRKLAPAPADCLQELQNRSAGLPIDVDFSSFPDPEIKEMMLHPATRIRSLLMPFSKSMLNHSAPLLEYLDLRTDSDSLRSFLFQGNTPSLRHIRFHGNRADWTSSILRNLTSLSMVGVFPSDARGDFFDVMVALENVPALPINRRAILPSLASLIIREELRSCVHLLGHLVLPRGPTILVETYNGRPALGTHDLVRAINSRLYDDVVTPTSIIALKFSVDDRMLEVYTTLTMDGATPGSQERPLLQLNIQYTPMEWASQPSDLLSLSDIRALSLAKSLQLTLGSGHRLFDGMINLRVCQVLGDIGFAFTTLLSTCFPSLERLCFHGTDFNIRDSGWQNSFRLLLASGLLARKRVFATPVDLEIKDCIGLNQRFIAAYGDIVGRLV
ncbi:hypothetical protein JAAARDRAFT_190108 [Jaapia argillacea MUCL 33604]|uniref:Uncharacterized protein n=1 Tax=Jaapia argillacea MUCL 33604 TaxID=933084 RepID=A0A067Q9J7_9AGAM|nr:hypothetical protein JAAARDRAFT_190108 [Jaapia argillacea MUCL 33604]